MEKYCVSEFTADDYLTREEQSRLLKTYAKYNVRRWHYSNAGTKVMGKEKNTVMFFSYYTAICSITHAKNGIVVMLEPYVYIHSNFVNSRTTNRQFHKFMLENNINVSMNDLYYWCTDVLNGNRVNTIKDMDDNLIDIQLNPYQTYVEKYGVGRRDKVNTKLNRIVTTADGLHCIGVFDD